MTRLRWTLCLTALLVPCLPLRAEPEKTADPDESRYELRREHDPDGIGKFYMGREIAQVMGHEAAGWLERPEREKEEQPSQAHRGPQVQAGRRGGRRRRRQRLLEFPHRRSRRPQGQGAGRGHPAGNARPHQEKDDGKKITNVEPIPGTITDPKLPEDGVDLIVMVDVYHEFDHPYEMTEAMVKALKPGGRLVFVEYRLEDHDVPIKLVHKMSQKQVVKEMAPHPLRYVKTLDDLPRQHIIIFEKKADEAPAK